MNLTNRITVAANAVTMRDRHTVRSQLRTFFQTLERIGEAAAITSSLADNAMKINLKDQIERLGHNSRGHGWVRLLADVLRTREDRACFHQESLRYLAESEGDSMGTLMQICGIIGRGDSDTLAYLRTEVFEPLAAYYLEEVGGANHLLRLLGLYKRGIEWFDRAELCAKLTEEKHWENHLRRFLLAHGVANPLSQTVASLGTRQDITFYEDEHPTVIEVKYQEDQSKVTAEVAKGVRQAYRYAEDLGSSTCYFVMFNKAKKQLFFEGARPGCPFFSRGGIGIYCVAVNLDLDSPSKVKTADAPLVLGDVEVFAELPAG